MRRLKSLRRGRSSPRNQVGGPDVLRMVRSQSGGRILLQLHREQMRNSTTTRCVARSWYRVTPKLTSSDGYQFIHRFQPRGFKLQIPPLSNRVIVAQHAKIPVSCMSTRSTQTPIPSRQPKACTNQLGIPTVSALHCQSQEDANEIAI